MRSPVPLAESQPQGSSSKIQSFRHQDECFSNGALATFATSCQTGKLEVPRCGIARHPAQECTDSAAHMTYPASQKHQAYIRTILKQFRCVCRSSNSRSTANEGCSATKARTVDDRDTVRDGTLAMWMYKSPHASRKAQILTLEKRCRSCHWI